MKEEIAFKYFNLSVLIHFIGRLLYMVFVPILLLNNGFSINQVLLYLLLYSFIAIIISFVSYFFVKKRNIIFINILAIISEVLLLFLLFPKQISHFSYLLIILFEGFYYGFYYMTYQPIITHYTTKKNIGKNIGNIGILNNLANMIAPILGGILLIFNKIYFILISLIFVVLSMIPLLKIVKTDINGHNLKKIKISEIKVEILNQIFKSTFAVTLFSIWAIYIYVKGATILDISYIPASIAVSNIVITYFIKDRLKEFGFRNWMKILGICGIMLVSIYRFFYLDYILLTNILIGFFFIIYYYCVDYEFLTKTKGYQTYFSSLIQQNTNFGPSILIVLLIFLVGLQNIILLPVFIAILYFIVNFKSLKKLVI